LLRLASRHGLRAEDARGVPGADQATADQGPEEEGAAAGLRAEREGEHGGGQRRGRRCRAVRSDGIAQLGTTAGQSSRSSRLAREGALSPGGPRAAWPLLSALFAPPSSLLLARSLAASMGWERSALGYPVSDELEILGGRGRVSFFQNGAIYWHRDTNVAYEIHGLIYQKYLSLGGHDSFLGMPTTDELWTPDRQG